MSKILIIVGHGKSKTGGYDSGAVSGRNHEFKIAREIAKYAVEYYNANYSEQCDLMNYDGDLYLQERINRLQDKTYDFIAEIHLNAGGGTGTEAYYYHSSENCKKYALAISESISSALGIKNRGAKTKLTAGGKDYFGIIRDTKPTSVLVETAFIDTNDINKILDVNGQKLCGKAIAEGIWKVRGGKADEQPKPQESFYGGRKIALDKAPIFISSDAKNLSVRYTGIYYLYDGKSFNGRYRICKEKGQCGGKISYVLGYVNKADIK